MLCDIDKDKNTQALASIDEHFTVQTKHQKTSVAPLKPQSDGRGQRALWCALLNKKLNNAQCLKVHNSAQGVDLYSLRFSCDVEE